MRPRNLKRKDRWYLDKNHPLVRQGYVYDRGGIAYICIGSFRKSLNIPFSKSNKEIVLQLLEKQIKAINYSMNADITTLKNAIKVYFDTNQRLGPKRKYILQNAIKIFMHKDFYLHDIDAIKNHLYENLEKAKKKYKNSTLEAYLIAVNQIFVFLKAEGYIRKLPLNMKLIHFETGEIKILTYTKEELNTIFNAFQDDKDYFYFFKFIYLTGCRLSEATNLKFADIKDTHIEVMGKGNRFRTIPLEPFPELQELITIIKEDNVNDREMVFCKKGSSYQKALIKILRANKMYEVGKGIHSFRKTRENELIHNENFSTKVIAELLGHTESVQRKHYLHILKGEELNKKLLREIEINKNYAQISHSQSAK